MWAGHALRLRFGGVLAQCLAFRGGWAWACEAGLAGAFLMIYSLVCGILEPYILDGFLNSSFKPPPFKGMSRGWLLWLLFSFRNGCLF
ncbi:hypothetical protein [Bartonella sp. CL436QHHD]|uniref:hypothetical protein n=1 Tax=Bartonella sp. CL436QHHD TaxID=3243531 RepID=UPI0035D004E3